MTHDGTVAVIEDGRLVFSHEMEKLNNNRRYEQLDQLGDVAGILARGGCRAEDIDVFVVDGWHADPQTGLARLAVTSHDEPVVLEIAPYHERNIQSDPVEQYRFQGLEIGGESKEYSSYHHATGHIFAAYCTSPFARRGEPSLVLVWDGGMLPHLYRVEPDPVKVVAMGPLFPLTGNAFSDFSAQFGPYRAAWPPRSAEDALRRNLEVAGKAMAYAALGTDHEGLDAVFDGLLDEIPDISIQAPVRLGELVEERRAELLPGLTDADIIASFQGYLGRTLVSSLSRVVRARSASPPNLCLSGGCALNIKWNSSLRSSGMFFDVWVPPFPNDSGSAIGTACAEMVRQGQAPYLEWDVYAGPALNPLTQVPEGMRAEACPPSELARVLHEEGEPVVVLHGAAELGPRALGHRSILAPATDPKMKRRLNEIKDREDYRPVAPICLESGAAEVFEPGTPDPYMLFEHRLRRDWAERVPAVIHLDGTARLQTVNEQQDALTVEVLRAYEKLSGIPLLCNTSANHKGSGFFPDVTSAAEWKGTSLIWSENVLYRRYS